MGNTSNGRLGMSSLYYGLIHHKPHIRNSSTSMSGWERERERERELEGFVVITGPIHWSDQ